jgi:beta-glucosidase
MKRLNSSERSLKIDKLYLDPSKPIDIRIKDLLSKMTLDEKLAQLGSVWIYELIEDSSFSLKKAKQLIKNGIGQITRLAGASGLKPKEAAKVANDIQDFLVNHTRLGIPAIIHEECLSGYMAREATIFPQIIGLASSWNPKLVEEVASEIKKQMRAVGVHQGLAPVLDVAWDPRWGRVEETFGEDPYLVACMGTHYIKGLQGKDIRNGIIATVKHFVAHGFSEGGHNTAPVHISQRELREVFMLPFEVAVKEGKVLSIMNAYHEIDGIPCAASKELLTNILRKEWGFNGFVVSDYFAINMLNEHHKVASDKKEAARLALEAGIDIELPRVDCYGNILKELVEQGVVSEKVIDKVVSRILRIKFLLGLFDNPYVDIKGVPEVLDAPKARELALRAARESIILLKNDGILPLDKDIESLAVIGPSADSWRNLLGDYSYPVHIEALIEMAKRRAFKISLPKGIEVSIVPIVTILQGIKEKVSSTTKVYYAKGCGISDCSKEGFKEAIQIAKKAKVAIVVVGERSGLTLADTSGESRDRAELGLPGVQEDLVKAIYETGTPIIVILINGRPLSIQWIAEKISAIIEAWFPGEEGGRAIADVLFGDYNPSGKLPITVPRAVGQVPIHYNHKPSGGKSHWWGDYVFTSSKPLFPFGHGMSYTKFEYSNLKIEPKEVSIKDEVKISVDVKNIGSMKGEEVVQLYINDVIASTTRPVKELKGFKKVTLEPGEKKTITFILSTNLLAFYNKDMNLVVEPGVFKVFIGSSSEDIRLEGEFTVTGEIRKVISPRTFFSEVITTIS